MRIGECLEFGWEEFKKHVGPYVLVTFVSMVANGAVNLVSGRVFRGFGIVVSMVVSGLFWAGFMVVARKGARGETPAVQDAFWPFTARQTDFVIVGLAMNAGLLLCGVGVLITSFLFLFAPLLVIEGADFKQALTRSKDLVLANTGEAIVFWLVIGVINMLGAALFGIGLLVSLPVSALAIVKAYELATRPAVLPPVVGAV